MAAKRVTLRSNFLAAKRAGRNAVEHARDLALNAGEAEAEKRLERVDDTRGYELPIDIQQETWKQSGKILYQPWYGKFFEYGTVYIPAAPFIRPAHRRMRKQFLASMGDDFEGFIRKRAGVRR